MSFDPKCYELAQLFIEDELGSDRPEHDALAGNLAQAIQSVIEDWIEDYQRSRIESLGGAS
jgi:hypothetical protein